MQKIFIDNQTTTGIISSTELKQLIEALQLQAKNDFNTSPWVEHGYCKPIEVRKSDLLPPSVGDWNLILLDKLPEGNEEALGYHEDVNGGKIPISYVGVKEAREDDTSISEVASHELIEMAVNPFVENINEMRIVKHGGREYVVEPCDPVESEGYRINNGQIVSNFVWPKYYGMNQTRDSIAQVVPISPDPFESFDLCAYGYISFREGPEKEFQQAFGDKRTELPKWASRISKIHGAK